MAKKPTIPTSAMSLASVDRLGSRWRVHLPEGLLADDLRDPAVWSVVQASNAPLRRFDELLCIGYAEDFAVMALVTEFRNDAATLAFVKLIDMKPRLTPTFNDGKYRTMWVSGGWGIERIADGFQMSGHFATEALAIAAIGRLHPRKVA